MDVLAVQAKIRELLDTFSRRVERENISDRYDINRLAEDIMLPVFRLLYGYQDLRNLNYTDARNYPGIDLADDTAKIAFQITSTSDNAKIIHTLETIKKHQIDKKYKRIVVYILTKKQGKYSEKNYPTLNVEFLKDRDIWDFKDLCAEVSKITDFARLARILEYLANTVGRNQPFRHRPPEDKFEELELNFIEIAVPETLYFADFKVDRDTLVEEIQARDKVQQKNYRPAHKIHDREVVCEHFDQLSIRYPKDFVCFKKQLLTFHDIADDEHPFYSAIVPQTIKTVSVKSFAAGDSDFDESKDNVVKELLGRCLTRMLVKHGVSWHHREKFYFFTFDDKPENYDLIHNKAMNRHERTERWKEKKSTLRCVSYRRHKIDLPKEITYYFHLAFKTRFHLIGEQWYLEIAPDWHASLDSYTNSRSFYDAQAGKRRTRKIQWLSDKVTEQKERENNQAVFNHFRFIRNFLRNSDSPISRYSENRFFIGFGTDVRFKSSPILEDKVWNPDFVKFEAEGADENAADEAKSKKKKRRRRKAAAPDSAQREQPNLAQRKLFSPDSL